MQNNMVEDRNLEPFYTCGLIHIKLLIKFTVLTDNANAYYLYCQSVSFKKSNKFSLTFKMQLTNSMFFMDF